MSREFEITVDGVSARYQIVEDLAPKTIEAFWNSLPVESHMLHTMRSGQLAFVSVNSGPLLELPQRPELMCASIYKGYMSVRPPLRPGGGVELQFSYGIAEYRSPTGRSYSTPVARLVSDGTELFSVMQRCVREGEKQAVIRKVEG